MIRTLIINPEIYEHRSYTSQYIHALGSEDWGFRCIAVKIAIFASSIIFCIAFLLDFLSSCCQSSLDDQKVTSLPSPPVLPEVGLQQHAVAPPLYFPESQEPRLPSPLIFGSPISGIVPQALPSVVHGAFKPKQPPAPQPINIDPYMFVHHSTPIRNGNQVVHRATSPIAQEESRPSSPESSVSAPPVLGVIRNDHYRNLPPDIGIPIPVRNLPHHIAIPGSAPAQPQPQSEWPLLDSARNWLSQVTTPLSWHH